MLSLLSYSTEGENKKGRKVMKDIKEHPSLMEIILGQRSYRLRVKENLFTFTNANFFALKPTF